MAPSRRRGARARALAVLAVAMLAASCGESGEERREAFCDDVRERGELVDPFLNLSTAGSAEELEQLFADNLASFRALAEDAPDEIADDMEILAEGIESYQGLLAGGGWDVAAVDQAELAQLQERYRPPSGAVNQWLKRCDIDTSAGATSTTAAGTSSTTG
jgi:hypothetical protein